MSKRKKEYKSREADPFVPHEFKTSLSYRDKPSEPVIQITKDAYNDMVAICKNAGNNEIGWLGTVSILGKDHYLIDSIFLPEQETGGATCEISNEDEELCEKMTEDETYVDRLRFWGHLHPGNSTSPSGQDDTQLEKFTHNEWFIRGIFGRMGRAEFTFFDFRKGLVWEDVSWKIQTDEISEELVEAWKAEVSKKVKAKVYVHSYNYQTPYNNRTNTNQGKDKEQKIPNVSDGSDEFYLKKCVYENEYVAITYQTCLSCSYEDACLVSVLPDNAAH